MLATQTGERQHYPLPACRPTHQLIAKPMHPRFTHFVSQRLAFGHMRLGRVTVEIIRIQERGRPRLCE